MAEAEAQPVAGAEPPVRRGRGEGALELDFPRGRRVRLALGGALLGFPGLGLWIALLVPALLGRSLSAQLANAVVALLLPVALAICVALPPWLLRSRQPRAARVRWDRWGIVELDGEHVRTAIAWEAATQRVELGRGGRLVQIRDDEGRAITLAEPAAAPAWLSRRKATARSLEALATALVDLPEGGPVAPDARDLRRPTMTASVAAATLALGVVGVPLFAVIPDLQHLLVAFASLLVCILCALPLLRPAHELLELLAWGRRFERAEEASVEEGEGSEALLRRADRSLVRIDLSAAGHPDALLATREGAPVWVVLPQAGWVPATGRAEVGPPVAAEAIETAHERAARGELLRAIAIELAARGAAVLFWGLAALSPVLR